MVEMSWFDGITHRMIVRSCCHPTPTTSEIIAKCFSRQSKRSCWADLVEEVLDQVVHVPNHRLRLAGSTRQTDRSIRGRRVNRTAAGGPWLSCGVRWLTCPAVEVRTMPGRSMRVRSGRSGDDISTMIVSLHTKQDTGTHDTANQHLNLPPLAEYAETIGHLSAIRRAVPGEQVGVAARDGVHEAADGLGQLRRRPHLHGARTTALAAPATIIHASNESAPHCDCLPACLPAMEERGPLSPTYLLGGPPPPPLTQWM